MRRFGRFGISPPERIGIKEDWGISIVALMRRASDLGVISSGQLKTFCFMNRNNRKQEPGRWPISRAVKCAGTG